MLYSKSTKKFVLLKFIALFFILFAAISVNAQNLTLTVQGQTIHAYRQTNQGLNVGTAGVKTKEEPLEGVTITVKRNGTTVTTTTSGKKGKYSFDVSVSSTDPKNDYVVIFSKDGMGPKMLQINASVPKQEFAKYPGPKYTVDLDIPLITTTVTGVEIDKAHAKIKWDIPKEHTFVVDPNQARMAISEDSKILGNPDKYYQDIVNKKKKADDKINAKNKAIEDARLKAEAEARRKEEEARLLAAKADAEKQRLEALRLAAIKRTEDSLAELERQKALAAAAAAAAANSNNTPTNPDVEEVIHPAMMQTAEITGGYDAAEHYSISVARKTLAMAKELKSREKSKNLSAKYETINVLTSLLNMVDEDSKKSRKQ